MLNIPFPPRCHFIIIPKILQSQPKTIAPLQKQLKKQLSEPMPFTIIHFREHAQPEQIFLPHSQHLLIMLIPSLILVNGVIQRVDHRIPAFFIFVFLNQNPLAPYGATFEVFVRFGAFSRCDDAVDQIWECSWKPVFDQIYLGLVNFPLLFD